MSPPEAGSSVVGQAAAVLQQYPIVLVLLCVLCYVAYKRLHKANAPTHTSKKKEKEYDPETVMNLDVRRSKAIEQLQAQYEQRAREQAEKEKLKKQQMLEQQAQRVALPSSGTTTSATTKGGYNPLDGTGGMVRSFKSERCVKRGG